jgi:hypothetical protein
MARRRRRRPLTPLFTSADIPCLPANRQERDGSPPAGSAWGRVAPRSKHRARTTAAYAPAPESERPTPSRADLSFSSAPRICCSCRRVFHDPEATLLITKANGRCPSTNARARDESPPAGSASDRVAPRSKNRAPTAAAHAPAPEFAYPCRSSFFDLSFLG